MLVARRRFGGGRLGRGAQAQAGRQVTVTRDRNGVAHIVAKNFTALGLGEGYAFAQDNLCTFADDIVTVRGQRSKFFGPTALAINYSAGSAVSNLQSDLYWRYVQASGVARRGLTAMGINGLLPQVRQVYMGFVAGYNRFLRSGKLRDPDCKGKPWVTPITMTDMILRGEQIVTEGSAQQFISDLELATPPPPRRRRGPWTRRSRVATDVRSLATLRAQFGDQADRAQGSNGIGIGALDTRSGHGMVLANPHFPWRGTERFWMAQLVVPGTLRRRGRHAHGLSARRHRLQPAHRLDPHRLDLAPVCPLPPHARPGPSDQLLPQRQASGHGPCHRLGPLRLPDRDPHLLHHALGRGPQRRRGSGRCLRLESDAPPTRCMTPSAAPDPGPPISTCAWGRPASVRDLFNIEAHYLAIPTFNTIAADDRGNAYYGDVGATPAVSPAELKRCLPAGISTLVFSQARVVTLDGSQTSCAPATFPGTPQAGLFDAAHLPHAFRRDYLENSNDSYWLANPNHPLPAYSPIIGLTRTVQGLRTRIGNQMIQARVKGTDHLGAAKFTLGTLQRMWESDRSELAALVLRDLVADCRAHPSQTASNGQLVDLRRRAPHWPGGTARVISRPAADGCSRCGTTSTVTAASTRRRLIPPIRSAPRAA